MKTEIHENVREALGEEKVLTADDIRSLRNRSSEAIFRYKVAFWVAIGIFNLILWVPLPLSRTLLLVVAIASLLFAFIGPVIGIRKHNRHIELLKDCETPPKKRKLSEPGQRYLEQVRKEGRSLVRAEAEVLEGSREGAVAG